MSIIRIVDGAELKPERLAMLQALYSRSNTSVLTRLDSLKEGDTNLEDALLKYYTGYGHKSIGDCGHTTVFIENVSMLAAKAIEDSPLFSGQETSSRYTDFTAQGSYVTGNNRIDMASTLLIRAYSICKNSTLLREKVGRDLLFEGAVFKSETQQSNAISARVFDIARGFLPCGAKTQLAWTTSLSHAADHLKFLMAHPLEEVRDLACKIYSSLYEKYPNSFNPIEDVQETVDYYRDLDSKQGIYYDTTRPEYKITVDAQYPDDTSLGILEEARTRRSLPVPAMFGTAIGQTKYSATIDWASWRDLQRHRVAHSPAVYPLDGVGIDSWYTDQAHAMGSEFTVMMSLIDAARKHADTVSEEFPDYKDSPEAAYARPMGTLINTHGRMDYHHFVYFLELRNTPFVHPTLRAVTSILQYQFEQGRPESKMVLSSVNDNPAKRGDQTITAKDGGSID